MTTTLPRSFIITSLSALLLAACSDSKSTTPNTVKVGGAGSFATVNGGMGGSSGATSSVGSVSSNAGTNSASGGAGTLSNGAAGKPSVNSNGAAGLGGANLANTGGNNGAENNPITMGGAAGAPEANPGSGGTAAVEASGGSQGDTTLASDAGAASGGTSSMDQSLDGDMPLVYDQENTGADCPLPTLPPISGLTETIAKLPDPFLMSSGQAMSSRADWRCRRAEISAMIQEYELGEKPTPPDDLSADFSAGTLSVTVTEGSNSITLSTTITTPSGDGPFPAIIGMDTGGTGSLPSNIFTSRGIATMTFKSSQLTPQSPSRGQGDIYKLYPDAKVGSMILWAWGVSRIIDGLEITADQNHIDLSRLAVTGCSYAGKMSLYAGAFDERIALTIPEESGGGGEAAWRVSASKTGTEDLEHAQGTSWYDQDLMQFNNSNVGTLPFDQHELAAMVAPRALLTLGNPDIDYLSTEAGYVSMKAAKEVYTALGIPERIGFSQVGGHGHCMFPSSQTRDVEAFVDKFLLGKEDANTDIEVTPYNTDLTQWIDWTTPELP